MCLFVWGSHSAVFKAFSWFRAQWFFLPDSKYHMRLSWLKPKVWVFKISILPIVLSLWSLKAFNIWTNFFLLNFENIDQLLKLYLLLFHIFHKHAIWYIIFLQNLVFALFLSHNKWFSGTTPHFWQSIGDHIWYQRSKLCYPHTRYAHYQLHYNLFYFNFLIHKHVAMYFTMCSNEQT